MTSVIRLLKILMSLVVVSAAGWLASNMLVFRYIYGKKGPSEIRKSHVVNVTEMMSADYEDCIKGNLKPYRERRHPLHAAMMDFSRAMENHGIEVVLIEPSVLYCMLRMEYKILLQKRGFNMTALLGEVNIVHFAVKNPVDDMLKAANPVLEGLGFRYYPAVTQGESWLSSKALGNVSTHHFYVRRKTVLHVVVMFERGDYFWHAALPHVPEEVLRVISADRLLFAKANSAYEWFGGFDIVVDSSTNTSIAIPSDPLLFLFEIQTSTFMECSESGHEATQRKSSFAEDLESAFLGSLEEMKIQFRSLLLNFFLSSGTLLGWYRECGIIPYTTDIDYASWAVDNATAERLVEIFLKNERLKLVESFGLPHEGYELRVMFKKTRVDLFFVYEDSEKGVYYSAGHRESKGYYFRYEYPPFTICSGDLLGRKVHVPCETQALLEAEYGPEWRKPVKDWHYEKSPHNVGPTVLWTADEKPRAYMTF